MQGPARKRAAGLNPAVMVRKIKNRVLTLVILSITAVLFLINACGRNESSSSGRTTTAVQFETDQSGCLTTVTGYDDFIEISASPFLSRDYIWLCTDYQGQSNVLVTIQFDNNGDGTDCMTFEKETTATGSCS
jgi:hypothetical protein